MNFAKRFGFVILNLLLVWHVFAIAISPASMPPSSPLLSDASAVARPYNQVLFLNHGYHYFAPNPGSSTILEFESQRDGDVSALTKIPDVDGYFPRLRYHRFFMLAENVWAFGEQPQREFIEAYARHFADRLKSDSVSVVSVSHDPAPMRRIMAGGDLENPSSYFREPLAEFSFSKDGTTTRRAFVYANETSVEVELSDDLGLYDPFELPSQNDQVPVEFGEPSSDDGAEESDEADAVPSSPIPIPD